MYITILVKIFHFYNLENPFILHGHVSIIEKFNQKVKVVKIQIPIEGARQISKGSKKRYAVNRHLWKFPLTSVYFNVNLSGWPAGKTN